MTKALRAIYVVGWHELFEPRYRDSATGLYRSYTGCPGWFREHIHTGEQRQRLLEAHGFEEMLAMIGLYDQIRQLAAATGIEHRGWIVDPFGKPIPVARIPATVAHYTGTALSRERAEVYRVRAEQLISAQWLEIHSFRPKQGCVTLPPRKAYKHPKFRSRSGMLPKRKAEAEAEAEQQIRTRKKKQKQKQEGAVAAVASPPLGDSAATASAACNSDRRTSAIALLMQVGFKPATARELADDYGPSRVMVAVECAAAKASANRIEKSPEAYIRGCLLNSWGTPEGIDAYRQRVVEACKTKGLTKQDCAVSAIVNWQGRQRQGP